MDGDLLVMIADTITCADNMGDDLLVMMLQTLLLVLIIRISFLSVFIEPS